MTATVRMSPKRFEKPSPVTMPGKNTKQTRQNAAKAAFVTVSM
jgi:hypothetical protein